MADEGAVYQEFAQAFIREGQRKDISLNISQSPVLPTDTDLVIAVGIKSALLAGNSRFPVLCVLVSKVGFEKLLHELPATRKSNTFSAIYLDQPIRRQLAMVTAVLPDAKRIGLLYAASPDVAKYRKVITDRNLELHEKKLGSTESLYHDLESVLVNSDVLLSIPDAEVYNGLSIRNILLATYRSKIPVVAFSPGLVKAGALCAVFSTPEQIAAQAVLLASQFDSTGNLSAAQYPAEFDIMINQQVAFSLAIQIRQQNVLVQEIKTESDAEGGAQ